MTRVVELDAAALLQQVAENVPEALRANIVVIGSIAAAWAFRDVSGVHTVATKDIDLLLRPAVDAVATGQALGYELLAAGWTPQFPQGREPGNAGTPDADLPALRLSPPGGKDGWFAELLAEPLPGQQARKHWRRLATSVGDFGLPSFRFMPIAVHAHEETPFGLRVARPACMALAHLLEHSDPDFTPIANLPGQPLRFTKDVGRAISLWWLAEQQSAAAAEGWLCAWRDALTAYYPDAAPVQIAASAGATSVADYLREAHAIARNGVLAPHGTTLEAFRRAHARLLDLISRL